MGFYYLTQFNLSTWIHFTDNFIIYVFFIAEYN